MPPTLSCDFGTVTWRLKANVHRPGVFTPRLSASREVILVASPSEDLREDTEGFAIERVWGDQMQYTLSVSGRMFPIGGTIPITLSFLPMEKVKIYKISAQLEGDPHVSVIIPIIDHWQSRLFFSRSSQRPAAPMPGDTSTCSPLSLGTKIRRFYHTLRQRRILPYVTSLQSSPQT
jgi:hypothetical protein